MKLSKRTLSMVLALVVALSATAFGTVAYMTDRASVTNTFTIGSIDIIVDETDVDKDDPTPTYPDTDVNGDGAPDDIEIDPDGTITITPGDPTPGDDTDEPIVIDPNDPTLPDVDEDGKPEIDIDGDGEPDIEVEIDPDTGDITITPIDPETGLPTDDPIVIEPNPVPETPRTEEGNDYDLIPGLPQTKDPTMTVKANSEECYVRFRLTINMVDTLTTIMDNHEVDLADDLAFLRQMVDINTDDWQLVKRYKGFDANDNAVTVYEFWYKTADMAGEDAIKVGTKTEDQKLDPLFTTFRAPDYLTGDDVKALAGLEIVANGDAIQTASFEDAKAAWDAFDKQNDIREMQE